MFGISASKRAVLIWGLLGLGLATQYNACSQQVLFSQSLASLKNELLSASIIVINRDAQYTNDVQVEVGLQNSVADEVFVTDDSTCNSGGVWEPMQATKAWTLSDKNKEVFVYARYRNKAEGISTGCISDSIVHDGEAPAILLNDPNMITNVNTPVFNFLAWDSISGVESTTCKWPNQSETACNLSSSNGNIAEGVYNVSVIAKDVAGNISDPTNQMITVDRTPPTVILNSGPSALSAEGNAVFAFTGQDNLSGIMGYECSKEVNTAFAACSSPVQWTVTEGAHKFFIRATDKAGNVSNIIEHAFVIDMTAPTVRILTGPNDFSNTKSATFTFDGTDDGQPISKFECQVDAGSYAGCTSPKTYSNLADGAHTFYVRGIDGAGLKSAPASRTWTIDTAIPIVKFTQTPAAITNATSAIFRYTITDVGTGVASAECALDSATYTACSVSTFNAAALIAGSHTLNVRGTDVAGNKSAVVSYTWKVDLKAPVLVLNSGPGQFSNSSTANFTFAATDDSSGIARVDCRLDAAAYAPCDSLTAHQIKDLVEGQRQVSIRAVDGAGNLSNVVLVNWTVDLTGPEIAYFQQPIPVIVPNVGKQSLGFTVTDASSGVQSVTCKLNGTATACASGSLVNLTGLSAGIYNFVITATDVAGNVATGKRTWEVRVPTLQTQQVQVSLKTKVDVIVIVDNSPSMKSEMQSMSTYFSKFLQQLHGLDWQVGIITTDPSKDSDAAKKDGRLIELVGMPGQFILNSTMDPTLANKVFGDTVQMETNGSGLERGILTAKRSIQRAFDGKAINAPHMQLLRDDAVLAFVVVSDAYDDISTPDDLINEVKAHWNGQKTFSFHSIVVPENSFTDPSATSVAPNDPCKGFRESVKYDGRIYYSLSDLTGGIKATECSQDYGSQLTDIGKSTVELITSATLNCAPVDTNADGKIDNLDVEVKLPDGSLFTNFVVKGNRLNFPSALPLGVNTVRYYCF